MEPKSLEVSEVDWRIVAVLLVESPRSRLCRLLQLRFDHRSELVAIRGLVGREETRIDLDEVLQAAPSEVETCARLVLEVMVLLHRQRHLVRVARAKRTQLCVMAEAVENGLKLVVPMLRAQLDTALAQHNVNADTYKPREF